MIKIKINWTNDEDLNCHIIVVATMKNRTEQNRTEQNINKQADEAGHFKGFQQNKRNYSWR
jgi:hypothetical protein